ncbi:uncharacterized protein LOC127260857 [Andrographis paniculata]|uniref:uncharacterized protein LOC127260857 n=1 Tax=Andrographis paniculata TaxID=175694 RepID=UPI0021E87A33|nr:uncharacterized protein LOC127260857 [Andrographis paniculata]
MFRSILVFLLLLLVTPIHGRKRHVINFRWPNLYPKSFAWDPKSDHFVVGSLRHPQLISVSDAGVVSSLLFDESLPPNSSFAGISIDPRHHRILAVVRRRSPPYNALAAYDLPTFRQLFVAPLDHLLPSPIAANDVTADYSGTAYVTDSANGVVFKITEQGEAAILSRSQAFKSGLNGVVYNPKGYLLATQSTTGTLFKVNVDTGTARRVLLNKDLTAPDGIALRRDGVVLVVSPQKLYFIKSDDSWSEGAVYDETTLEGDGQANAVVAGAENRAYALYGFVNEGIMGNSEREEFNLAEIISEEENKEEKIWIYVLIGLGLAYSMVWRFQMRQLVKNMDKKRA